MIERRRPGKLAGKFHDAGQHTNLLLTTCVVVDDRLQEKAGRSSN